MVKLGASPEASSIMPGVIGYDLGTVSKSMETPVSGSTVESPQAVQKQDIIINIKAHSSGNMLTVIVTNPFNLETTSPNKGTGFGLSSVQRRLYLVFAQHELLKTHTEENIFITTINIPQQP